MTIALKDEEYEALVAWARLGAESTSPGALTQFYAMRNRIDRDHKLQRYTLTIRYRKLAAWGQIPTVGSFEELKTPQGETKVLELLRPPTRADVLQQLDGEIYNEALVWVTADPFAQVGWYDLEHYPW